MLMPLGCLVAPLASQAYNADDPIRCSLCLAYMNNFVKFDRTNNMWWCPFCEKRTRLPKLFTIPPQDAPNADIPSQIRPSSHGTVEYEVNDILAESYREPVVAYVIDKYQHLEQVQEAEFEKLKSTISEAIDLLPTNSKVYLVSFDENVEFHSTGESPVILPRIYGEKYDFSRVLRDLALHNTIRSRFDKANFQHSPSEAKSALAAIRPTLTRDFKPPRSTGTAILCTQILMSHQGTERANINIFLSGPGTLEPGKIVSPNEPIRSHHDVSTLKAPHYIAASKFYQALSFVTAGYSMEDAPLATTNRRRITDFSFDSSKRGLADIYSGSLDQVGVYEMRHLCKAGSGTITVDESFSLQHFRLALLKNTERMIAATVNAQVAVLTSTGLKTINCLSSGTDLPSLYQAEKHHQAHHDKISDLVTRFESSMGKRNFTNRWYIGRMHPDTTLAVFFEMLTEPSATALNADNGIKHIYVQFVTTYTLDGRQMMRVTTVKRPTTLYYLSQNIVKLTNGEHRLVNTKSVIIKETKMVESFNAEAAMVLLTRLMLEKIDTLIGYESFDDVVDKIDSVIVRLTKFFGGAKVELASASNPYSATTLVTINERLKQLPELSYHLRRNPNLVKIFNRLPDETASGHHVFKAAALQSSLQMIRPTLYKIIDGLLRKVFLEEESLQTDSPAYFVLDLYFSIIIYYAKGTGTGLALHNSQNEDIVYASPNGELGEVLKVTRSELCRERSFTPPVILTQTGHSQARFLLSRLASKEVSQQETKKSKWWFFNSLPKLIADDVSVDEYTNELLERVKKFLVESDND